MCSQLSAGLSSTKWAGVAIALEVFFSFQRWRGLQGEQNYKVIYSNLNANQTDQSVPLSFRVPFNMLQDSPSHASACQPSGYRTSIALDTLSWLQVLHTVNISQEVGVAAWRSNRHGSKSPDSVLCNQEFHEVQG